MFASCFADPLAAMDRLGWLLVTCRPGGRARVLWLFVHLPELFGDTLDGRPIMIVLTRPVRRELSHLDPLAALS
ncbi:hypothetical protein A6A05_17745 [Magnetospirillum moscoviense]|uniref:Uncharacterized protein n=2 Tax=Magnetospirillum moscoviense TaxID=1437059 RepID=A0A178M5R6_9PROT|nr:hypothetical protein A6A05_17745 [Magnetospirillum moscoviense]